MNLRDLGILTDDLKRRVRSLARTAIISLIDDGGGLQSVQLQGVGGEQRSNSVRMQNYGFQSYPFEGAEALALSLGGDGAHTVVICVDDRRYRLKSLAQGEVALYTDENASIILKRGRIIEITADTVHFIGDVSIDGAVGVQKDLTVNGSGGIAAPNGDVNSQGTVLHSHVHTGVMSGGSETGPPV